MNFGFGGPLSSGKTNVSIGLIRELSGNGNIKKVISAIGLTGIRHYFMDSEKLTNFLYTNKKNKEELKKMFFNSVLFLDEIKNYISAKKTTSNLNETWEQFLMMAGKLDCDVIVTYQNLFSQVDKEFRYIIDMFFQTERVGIDKKPLPLIYQRMRIPRDKYGKLIPILIKVKLMLYEDDKLFYTGKCAYLDPMDNAGFYNTREMVILDREQYLKK